MGGARRQTQVTGSCDAKARKKVGENHGDGTMRPMSQGILARPEIDVEVVAGRKRIENLFFHQSMAVLAAALIVIAIVSLKFYGYRLPWSAFEAFYGYLGFGAAIGYCRWAKYDRLVQSCWLAFWSCFLSTLLRFPMYLAARSHVPLWDQSLAHIDHMMGIEVPAILHSMALHPWVKATLNGSYDLLYGLLVLAVILPTIRYKFRAAKELIISTSFATLLGSLVFGLCPAVGPWSVYGYAPTAFQNTCANLLLTLRTGRIHVLDMDESGIVCFPSFHVLLAILACVALWSIKPLRIPAVIVALLVSASTLTTGWHYIVDVIGGILLALISWLVAKAFTRIESTVDARRQMTAS